jgi:hydrophobic/amphiphilic exporter-1 (mainly G- bacteria), HAE1 family
MDAGRRRFQPVILTSITTIAGLTPMLLETSFQGQSSSRWPIAWPSAWLAATALILLLVPAMYCLYARAMGDYSLDHDQPDDSLGGAGNGIADRSLQDPEVVSR